ncbi:translation initiation factor IF-3, putative [Babesia ovata]|uniref:Translation initiation factor IF-3, putative n=1 Tax=Babesia ovata TaxID=189622 RepID=A0A2H6KKF1_9APIC|nr:translation initiation factor IF-3, putative [Babesia ovata]GBE63457.1 translation initiation factor IF-3, putative [Babesia ovata]
MELARTIYIDVIGTGGQWDWKNITQAIEAGKQRIIQIVKGFGVKANLSADDVEATLRSVKSFLDQGPSKIDQEVKGTEVAGVIETKATSGKNTNNQHLISAIKAIFGSICAKASAASKDIQTLIEEPNISNLKQALTTSPILVAKLGKADAHAVDSAIYQVRHNVEVLEGRFRTHVKHGLDPAVQEFNTEAQEQIKAINKAIDEAVANFQMTADGTQIDVVKT